MLLRAQRGQTILERTSGSSLNYGGVSSFSAERAKSLLPTLITREVKEILPVDEVEVQRIPLNATNTRVTATKTARRLTDDFFSCGAFFLTNASFLFDSKITELTRIKKQPTYKLSHSLINTSNSKKSRISVSIGERDYLPLRNEKINSSSWFLCRLFISARLIN